MRSPLKLTPKRKRTAPLPGLPKVVNETFYTALFSDSALTQRISDVKALVLQNTYTNSVTFTSLPYGTYYVGETDSSGTPISSAANITKVVIEGGTVNLTQKKPAGSAVIKNTVPEGVLGAYVDIRLTVNKKVLDSKGNALNVTDTFYFALYSDKKCTNRVRGTGIMSVSLNNASSGSVTFRDLPYASAFYVAEVDKNGNKVASSSAFNYNVSVSGDGLTYREADGARVSVTNQLKEGRVAAENRNATNPAVRTGDETPIMQTIILMMMAGIAALYLALRRRRRRMQ